jgi:hypothetical protein
MTKLALLLTLVFMVSGCGATTPCTNEAQDPTGICATSHSKTY